MTKTTAKQAITDQVERYLNLASLKFGVDIDNVHIDFSLRGRTMGTANSGTRKLRFNLTALDVEGGWKHLIGNTVGHEVAHLVQYLHPDWPKSRQINKPHGVYWQRVMRAFGLSAQRCHTVDLPKARVQRRWDYVCGCAGTVHQISTTLHRKMQRGQRRVCCKCRSAVRPK